MEWRKKYQDVCEKKRWSIFNQNECACRHPKRDKSREPACDPHCCVAQWNDELADEKKFYEACVRKGFVQEIGPRVVAKWCLNPDKEKFCGETESRLFNKFCDGGFGCDLLCYLKNKKHRIEHRDEIAEEILEDIKEHEEAIERLKKHLKEHYEETGVGTKC